MTTEQDWPFDSDEIFSEAISFTSEDIAFVPQEQEKIQSWIQTIIEREACTLQQISYIFCSDDYLHEINVAYLDHDTYTDIITFPYSEPPTIHSDIFISVDRVRENAKNLNISFENELHRVMIHGVLHLCGYPDKTEAEAKQMRSKEDEALTVLAELSGS